MESAKVGLTTLGQPRLSEGAQPYPLQETGGSAEGHFFQVPGLGRRVSGSATQVQAQVQALCHLSSVINSAINPALHSVLHSDLYSALPYLPFLLCFLRYSTGVHPISA